ncbi:MAG: CotH kinase family protein [Planctomycetales bacterium]|nr:CotH kinase family protein [Planctomycetales bacterium]
MSQSAAFGILDLNERPGGTLPAGPGGSIAGGSMRKFSKLAGKRQRKVGVQLGGEALETRCVLAGEPLLISEFMAANVQFLQDRYKEYSDWIEIYNPTDQDVSMDGWALTDDPGQPMQWVFPDVTISSHGTQLVFASGRNRASATSELHTNFKLGTSGDYLALVRPDGSIAHEYAPEYPLQQGDISYGVAFDANGPVIDTYQYFGTPTPGEVNRAGLGQFAEGVSFDVPRGFFDQPFSVQLTTTTPNGLIRYTTDGSEPTAEHGELYTGPLQITTTTALRAVSYRDDMLPGDIGTETYIFLDDVIQQTGKDMGLPTQWGYFDDQGPARPARGQANYAMDPDIVNNPTYAATIKDDLRAIPTLSLVIDPNDLWDLDTGIYMNPEAKGAQWERPVSMELIQPDGETAFHVDAGLQIHGGWARRISQTGKFSFRVAFKGQYGDSLLEYPLFGDEGNSTYDEIVLRGGFNDSWANSDRNNTYMQDQWTRATQLEMGGLAPRQTYVHLYLNGLYWGMYSPTERPDALWAANYLGGDPDEYDVINTGGNIVDGTGAAWGELVRAMSKSRFDYQRLTEIVDLEAFADYLIVNQYIGNWDWPHNNWYASRHRVEGGKWYFHSWDAEAAFQQGITSDRVTSVDAAVGPSDLYTALRSVPEFQEIFANRVAVHFYNDGVLTPERDIERLNDLAAQIEQAIVGESARWGDGRTNANSPVTQAQWAARVKSLNETYFPRRGDSMLTQYRRNSLFPNLDPPNMSPRGGRYADSTDVSMSTPLGDIYFTRDGSDPRGLDGLPTPQAIRFNSYDLVNSNSAASYLVPTSNAADANWMSNAFDDVSWSTGLAGLGYDNGLSDDSLEVIGGFNVKTISSKSSLATLEDVDTLLAGANQDVVIEEAGVPVINYHSSDRDGHFSPSSIAFPIPGNHVAQEITAKLRVNQPGTYTFGVTSNDSARLSIDGQVLYADTTRHSANDVLVTVDLATGEHDVNLTFFQRLGVATLEFYFAPGAKDAFDDSFVLVGDQQERPYGEYLTTDLRAAMYEKNSSVFARMPFQVDDPQSIGALEMRVKYDDGFVMYLNGTEVVRRNAPETITYNSTSEASRFDAVALVEELIDLTEFQPMLQPGANLLAIQSLNASAADNDLLLLPQLVAYMTPTPVQVNSSEVLTARLLVAGEWSAITEGAFTIAQPAKADSLRVSEVHYHPAKSSDAEIVAGFDSADDFEFIELVNVSDHAIDLTAVSLTQVETDGGTQGLAFDFAGSNIDSLAPGAHVVVVENLGAFRFRYGPNVPVAGQWSGGLSNSSELLTVTAGGQLLQQFTYEDKWYQDTDGTGASLERTNPADTDLASWNAAVAWQASLIPGGTPGYAGGSLPGDANHDGVFNTADLLQVMQAAEFEDGIANNSTWEEGDWNRDGEFDSRDFVLAFMINTFVGDDAPAARAASMMSLQDEALQNVEGDAAGSIDELARLIAASRTKSRGSFVA